MGLKRFFPFLVWRQRVTRENLRFDLVAGLTGAIILVPQGVAFATIAGMPPEYGLYAAMLPAILAALWGSSWHLVSGPTTAISIVVFAAISPLAEPGSPAFVSLVLTLTFLAGVFQLALGALRLGTLVNFVSHTVVVGFTSGAALLIAASQVGNFFGIPIPRGAAFHEVIGGLVAHLGQLNPHVTAVALITVVACQLVRHWRPRWPYMIFGMVIGALLAAALNHWAGPEVTSIRTIGALSVGLPPLSSPDLRWETLERIAPIALALALLALTEAVSIARAVALKSGQRIDGNQEFIGQGLSNLAGSFFSGYASSGSFNRTGLNHASGAKTPLAAVFSAVFLLLIVMFLAPLAVYLPIPAMAGILFVVAWGLFDGHHMKAIWRVSRPEAAVLFVTFVATLSMALEFAIYVGVVLSLILYLQRTSRPGLDDVKPHPAVRPLAFHLGDDQADCPQLKCLRLNGSIFFGAVDHLQEEFQKAPQKHLLLVASGINFVDTAGAQLLSHEAARLRALGGGLSFFNLKEEPMRMLQRSGAAQVIGSHNFFPLGSDPVQAMAQRLDPRICAACPLHPFEVCAGLKT